MVRWLLVAGVWNMLPQHVISATLLLILSTCLKVYFSPFVPAIIYTVPAIWTLLLLIYVLTYVSGLSPNEETRVDLGM